MCPSILRGGSHLSQVTDCRHEGRCSVPVVVASSTRSADALISYALEDKPGQQGERYVMASGVGGLLVSVAHQQMRDVRKKWRKDKPGAFVQAYHVIQSFAKDELDPDDPDAWMIAQNLGRALAEDRFPGRHVLVVTQRDGRAGCLHNHLVANSVETRTGRSLNSSIVSHARLVEAHERVLEEQGFEQRADLKQVFSDATERLERGEPSGLRKAESAQRSELQEYHRYVHWVAECELINEHGGIRRKEPFSLMMLKSSIEQSLADPAAVDWDSFVEIGRSRGVRIEKRGKGGRGISYGMLREEPDGTLAEPAASDRRRCSTLGSQFEMDAVEEALARNSEAQLTPAQNAPARVLTPKEHMAAALQEAAADGAILARQLHLKTPVTDAVISDDEKELNQDLPPNSAPPGTITLEQLSEIRGQDATLGVDAATSDAEPSTSEHLPVEQKNQEHDVAARSIPSNSQKNKTKPLPLHVRFPELADSAEPSAPRRIDRSFGD